MPNPAGRHFLQIPGNVFAVGHLGDFNNLMPIGTLGGVEMGLANAIGPSNRGVGDAALDYLAGGA